MKITLEKFQDRGMKDAEDVMEGLVEDFQRQLYPFKVAIEQATGRDFNPSRLRFDGMREDKMICKYILTEDERESIKKRLATPLQRDLPSYLDPTIEDFFSKMLDHFETMQRGGGMTADMVGVDSLAVAAAIILLRYYNLKKDTC